MYEKTEPGFFLVVPSVVKKGKERSISDIKKFVDHRKWEFSSLELFAEVLQFITVETALLEWLETVENPETKRKYRRAIQKIFFENCAITLILPAYSIECLAADSCSGMYGRLMENLGHSESTKKLFLTAYARFCDFIRTKTFGLIDPEVGLREQESFHRAEDIYNEVDWLLFFDTIEMPYRLIAKLIYLSAKLWQYRLRISDRYKNVLSLKVDQIDFKKNIINFNADQSYHVIGLTIALPDTYMEDLKAYLKNKKSQLVFTSAEETRLFPNQMERALEKASKSLQIRSKVTPVLLSWIGVIAHKEATQKQRSARN